MSDDSEYSDNEGNVSKICTVVRKILYRTVPDIVREKKIICENVDEFIGR